ncbi:MAG: hypothetical protein JXP73_08785 [Deltaproteobacteria bacterium]|nr:hypothetical protein [Deltaproteobacteria bacterium]
MAAHPSREELRRRVLGWRAAERVEQRIHMGERPPAPDEALAWADELCALNPAAMSAPDSVRERGVDDARRAWDKLRARLGWQPGSKTAA